jgi:hypothetical protein
MSLLEKDAKKELLIDNIKRFRIKLGYLPECKPSILNLNVTEMCPTNETVT